MSLSWRDYILNSHIKVAKEIAAKLNTLNTIPSNDPPEQYDAE
jgi:hypothetical protein